ncbi:MAG: hypothetical protein U1E15_13120 [Hyphomicrobiales bacterium]
MSLVALWCRCDDRGSENDYFVIETFERQRPHQGNARCDIVDFTDGEDSINLQNLDADTRTAFNDSFATLILGNGSFVVGQAAALRIYETSTGWMIEGEVNGDGKADFSIAVDDMDHSIAWQLISSDDFVA